MAKALIGYATSADPRQQLRLVRENRQLRQRIADLESVLVEVQIENEALSALLPQGSSAVLEPV